MCAAVEFNGVILLTSKIIMKLITQQLIFFFLADVKDVPLPKEYRQRIDKNYAILYSDVDLSGILPKLKQHGSMEMAFFIPVANPKILKRVGRGVNLLGFNNFVAKAKIFFDSEGGGRGGGRGASHRPTKPGRSGSLTYVADRGEGVGVAG